MNTSMDKEALEASYVLLSFHCKATPDTNQNNNDAAFEISTGSENQMESPLCNGDLKVNDKKTEKRKKKAQYMKRYRQKLKTEDDMKFHQQTLVETLSSVNDKNCLPGNFFLGFSKKVKELQKQCNFDAIGSLINDHTDVIQSLKFGAMKEKPGDRFSGKLAISF